MQSLKQTRFLAANYSALQGLRTVPVGLWIILVSLWTDKRQGDIGWPLLLLVVTVVLTIVIDQYYKRIFGRVKPSRENRRRDFILSAVLVLLCYGAFVVDTAGWLPVSTFGLLIAILNLEEFIRLTRLYKSMLYVPNLVMSVLLAIVSLLPLVGMPGFWSALGIRQPLDGVLFIIGVLTVIGGVFSHVYLVRSLPARMQPNEGLE